jgi:glycosyltransferase involved in cell wall biosynthesis
MSTLAAFSKYLAYDVGGAEQSTRSLLRDRQARGDAIVVVSAANAQFVGQPAKPALMPMPWTTKWLDGFAQQARFPHVEYLRNRERLRSWFARLDADALWAYGMWAPAAVLGFRGETTYFVRSETDLGIVGNHRTGAARLARSMYGLIESPAVAAFRADLRSVARTARIIANSQYMARRVGETLGVDAQVWLPPVDVDPMRARLVAEPCQPNDVVFVGDNAYKGLPLVLALAARFPELPFRIHSRFVTSERREANVRWVPWQTEPWRVYAGARLMIVPSQWEEAYGRVAREALLLGVPVLASRVGGLPEAVDDRDDCLVTDFRNPGAWEDAIRRQIVQ